MTTSVKVSSISSKENKESEMVIIDKFGEGVYVGDIIGYNTRHGLGKTTYTTGSADYPYFAGAVYEGNYVKNKAHGEGCMRYANGETYQGCYENDLRHGDGALALPNGDTYNGHFEKGLKHGLGTYCWANGDAYTGEWKNDKRNGKGVMTYHNSDTPVPGQWSNDVCYWHSKFDKRRARK